MFCNEDYLVNKAQACDICGKNNYLLIFFSFLSFIPFTTVVSAVIIARYVYIPHVRNASKEEDLSDDEEEEEILYENKYPLDKSLVAGEDQDTNNLTVSDSTPDGLVFIDIIKKRKVFIGGVKKGINYKYLETVARKYVKIFRCSNYYIDREESLKNEIEQRKMEEEKEKMKDEDKKEDVDSDDDLFVKLKPNEKVKPKKIEKIAAKRANKYKYCGKVSDFEMLKKVVKPKKKFFFKFCF